MQHPSNSVYPQSIGGIHKKGIGMGEQAMIQIIAGLCSTAEVWQKSPEEIVVMAQRIHDELFRYKPAED
ncbi:MAG: hypothetical protein R3E90_07190 [Marinicella sp.]|nr:hypothetical protein [Xanthomonadales bacterium]